MTSPLTAESVSTKVELYTLCPDHSTFTDKHPKPLRGVWKNVNNDFTSYKRKQKAAGKPISDADAYRHTRHNALQASRDIPGSAPHPPSATPSSPQQQPEPVLAHQVSVSSSSSTSALTSASHPRNPLATLDDKKEELSGDDVLPSRSSKRPLSPSSSEDDPPRYPRSPSSEEEDAEVERCTLFSEDPYYREYMWFHPVHTPQMYELFRRMKALPNEGSVQLRSLALLLWYVQQFILGDAVPALKVAPRNVSRFKFTAPRRRSTSVCHTSTGISFPCFEFDECSQLNQHRLERQQMEIFADMEFLLAEEEYKATGKIDMSRGAELYKRIATKPAGERPEKLNEMVLQLQSLQVEMESLSNGLCDMRQGWTQTCNALTDIEKLKSKMKEYETTVAIFEYLLDHPSSTQFNGSNRDQGNNQEDLIVVASAARQARNQVRRTQIAEKTDVAMEEFEEYFWEHRGTEHIENVIARLEFKTGPLSLRNEERREEMEQLELALMLYRIEVEWKKKTYCEHPSTEECGECYTEVEDL